MDDLDDSDPDNLQVESDNFLNGNDMDPSEDRWTNNLDDPSSFLMEETITVPITQTITVGKPKSEITQTLVDYAKIEKDCILIGVNDHIEVWEEQAWNEFLNSNESNYSDIAEDLFMI
jgi:hypothetical protein